VSPDVAVCNDCLAEMRDPSDRRYRHPFINCTNCGPRFTITMRLPYDRPNTTMAGFDLCAACEQEYANPSDRRFHAQPIACPRCGPHLWFEPAAGREHQGVSPLEGTDRALAAAQEAISSGQVVAVKGVGGYHLACDATNTAAVAELRRRKDRPHKPLAVMVPDLGCASEIAFVTDEEARLLAGPERPIVLLARRPNRLLSELLAPGHPQLGVLLPYAPLHHLLFQPVPGATSAPPRVLVMTSGNLTDEPICYQDLDARERLGRIADAWLLHDRPIHVPCDDSVLRIDDGFELPIRRSRGYTPLPVRLPFSVPPLLAAGGELKNAFCVASGRDAWVSQHIGDMGSLPTLRAFERSVAQFCDLYEVSPERWVADAHPGYHSRRWVDDRAPGGDDGHGAEIELVQHHHAHVAAVMAEHGVPPEARVIGVAFDGTGYGDDGAIWGGEVLVAGYGSFHRAGHLGYVPLPGGHAAVARPYRVALAHLWAAGVEWSDDLAPVRAAAGSECGVLQRQLDNGLQCVPTSSMGRLFDAVSSLVGLRHVATYEAEAAIELEMAARSSNRPCRYRFGDGAADDAVFVADNVIRTIVEDLRHGRRVADIAAGFHLAVSDLVVERVQRLRDDTGIEQVVLSGGVFQNVVLVRVVRAALAARGFAVLTHRMVPPNDGGLALGQAVIGGYRALPVGVT
jgi:hydrogenase maturation protein HypF